MKGLEANTTASSKATNLILEIIEHSPAVFYEKLQNFIKHLT
jgi:hypothetical protein